MANTIVEFEWRTGQTLTARICSAADATVQDSLSATERTNAKGRYYVTVTAAATGHCTLHIHDGSDYVTPVLHYFLADDTDTYFAMPAEVANAGGYSKPLTAAETNTECDTALTDYDPPTNAEMEARTILAASYFDPAADTVANVSTVATLTGHTPQTADHTAAIADIPTVAEFEARTLVAASYFDPAADTVATVTALTNLPSITANWLTASGLAADAVTEIQSGLATSAAQLTANEIADGVLCRDWTAVSGEASRSVLNALRLLRNKTTESGGALTVKEEDDTTTAWTAAVTTDAAADPITEIDPA